MGQMIDAICGSRRYAAGCRAFARLTGESGMRSSGIWGMALATGLSLSACAQHDADTAREAKATAQGSAAASASMAVAGGSFAAMRDRKSVV